MNENMINGAGYSVGIGDIKLVEILISRKIDLCDI